MPCVFHMYTHNNYGNCNVMDYSINAHLQMAADEGGDDMLKKVFTCSTAEEVTAIFRKYVAGDRKKRIPKEYAQHRIGLANREGKECFFYLHYQTKDEQKWYPFSNFLKSPITIDGITYPTTETFFQCEKVNPKNLQGKGLSEEEIEACRQKWQSMVGLYAGDAAKRGRDRDTRIAPDWDNPANPLCESAMYCALKAKFTQHADLRELLLSTEERRIVEDTAQSADYKWGCGADGTGRNLLGEILMRVRKDIREESA